MIVTEPGSMAFDDMSRDMEGFLQKAKEQLSGAGIREARAPNASAERGDVSSFHQGKA